MRLLSSVYSSKHCQHGSTLLVTLIMLVLLTLIAISAIKSTSSSIQVVGNAQFRAEARAAVLKAVETVLSTGDFRNATPDPQPIDVNGHGAFNFTVTFAPAPACTSYQAVSPGDAGVPSVCASSIGAVCYWTTWDIRAVVDDVQTGASVVMHQGVRTIAGLDAAVASCGV